MPTLDLLPPHRWASKDDAEALFDLVNYASNGIANYLFTTLARNGEDARAVGLRMIRADTTRISYINAIVVDHGAGVVAGMIGNRLPDAPQPIASDAHPITVPWLELRNQVCGCWHLTTIAVYPEHRGIGLGSSLLSLLPSMRLMNSARGICLHVADSNLGARRLYERYGFRLMDRRPMAQGNWKNPGREWLLYRL